MPKAKGKEKVDRWSAAGLFLFAFVVAGSIGYLFIDSNRAHEELCSVKTLDQLTGLVLLECIRK